MSVGIALVMMAQVVTLNNDYGLYKGPCYEPPTGDPYRYQRDCFFDLVKPSKKKIPDTLPTILLTERYSGKGWDCVEQITILTGNGSMRSQTTCYAQD